MYPKTKGLPCSSKPLKIKYDSWLRGLDLNQRPSGYEPEDPSSDWEGELILYDLEMEVRHAQEKRSRMRGAGRSRIVF